MPRTKPYAKPAFSNYKPQTGGGPAWGYSLADGLPICPQDYGLKPILNQMAWVDIFQTTYAAMGLVIEMPLPESFSVFSR